MPWSLKSKTDNSGNWGLKSKTDNTANWGLSEKVPQQGDTLFILTPDSNYILVGSSEDLFLIYQEEYNNWNLKTKIES